MTGYIDRDGAVAAYAAEDPNATSSHIFQGDVFHAIEMVAPGRGMFETAQYHAVVISHHCEYTKAKARGSDYPLLVAPARDIDVYPNDQHPLINDGRVVYLFPLPAEDPVDETLVVDLRLLQPIEFTELSSENYLATLSPGNRDLLLAKLLVFLTRPPITNA